jgi:hypothetical protein
MMETIKSMWYYLSRNLAPLLWINLLALSLSYWRDKDKDTDARSRREKRAESQHRRCYDAKRGRMRQGSIRDYNPCSSYPLCLRQRGLYRGRPPNVCQRMNAKVTQNVVTAGLRVTNSVRNNGRNPMRAGRDGGRDRCSCTRTPSYRCGCTRTQNYRPTPMNPPTEGNYNWTQRQHQAIRKIVVHVNMLGFELETPTNPATL